MDVAADTQRRLSDGEMGTDMGIYDDVTRGLAAELLATTPLPPVPVNALPDKAYLEATVLPLLLRGLECVTNERPSDSVAFLAAYLLSNNPQRDGELPTPPVEHPMLMGCLPHPPPPVAAAAAAAVSGNGAPNVNGQ